MYDPDERISARQALKHHYFKDMRCVPAVEAVGDCIDCAITHTGTCVSQKVLIK